MPPKRMPKVTSLPSSSSARSDQSGAGTSRNGSARAANPFGPVNPASYTDYDEAMEDAIELEEKGERFAIGAKAQRFYEQAYTLYRRAQQLSSSSSHQADSAFNAARVQFILGTQFCYLPKNVSSLVESVKLGKLAQSLAPALPEIEVEGSETANPFTLDVMTHLATSLQSLAELIDEVGWPSQEHRISSHDSTVFSSPYGSQSSPATPSMLWQEAVSLFQLVAQAQHALLLEQQKLPPATSSASEEEVEDDQALSHSVQDIDSSDAASRQDDSLYGYTSSLVTTVTLLETLVSLIDCFTSLLRAAPTREQVETASQAATSVGQQAETLFSESSGLPILEGSERSDKQQELLRAQLSLRTATISKAVEFAEAAQSITNPDLKNEIVSGINHVQNLANSFLEPSPSGSKPSVDVPTFCDVGEAGQVLCRLSLRLLMLPGLNEGSPNDASETVQAIWTLATVSTKLFSSALAALDTSSAGTGGPVVLGQANTSTPTSRARCRILIALSNLSLFRAHPIFESSGLPGAVGTRVKLVDNARLYIRKAITEIGLARVLKPLPQTRSGVATTATLPTGGWESLTLEAEAIFNLLRALIFRYKLNANESNRADLESELKICLAHLQQLRQSPVDGSQELAQWLYTQGITTFVDEIVEENGKASTSEEVGWWQEILSQS